MLNNISWRNIWRNKTRSIVLTASVAIGLFGGIFSFAFYNGMAEQTIDNSISTEISNIQIHNPKFADNQEAVYGISEPEKVIAGIRSVNGVKGTASRLLINAMAASANSSSGILVKGVDPDEELIISNIKEKISEGSYFNTGKRYPAVISSKLAEKLKIGVNKKIILTMQNPQGVISGAAFRVAGIFKTDNTNFDEAVMFVLKEDLAEATGFDPAYVNEIAVRLDDPDDTKAVVTELGSKFSSEVSAGKIIMRGWYEINPFLEMVSGMTVQMSVILIIIILCALMFGIVNTMLMSVLERVREIGMLMAIGMNGKKIFVMIMLETIYLSLTGGAAGMLLSIIAISVTGYTGIDLSFLAEGLNSYGYSSYIFPAISPFYFLMTSVFVIITAVLSSVLPARRALKLNPAEAIRQN